MKKTMLPFIGNYIDRAVAGEMVKLANQLQVAAAGKSIPDMTERTAHSGDWNMLQLGTWLGQYNPDDIPIETYKKMRWDGQIRLGLAVIKLPILSRQFYCSCENADVAVFVEKAFTPIWRALLKSSLTGLDYGFAAHEKVWMAAPQFRVLDVRRGVDFAVDAFVYKKFKDLEPDSVTIDYSGLQDFDGFTQNKGYGNAVKIDAEKAFVFTHDKEFGNVYGWARLKSAYPYWYAYWIVDKWHQRWIQKLASEPVVISYPPGRTIDGFEADGITPKYIDNAALAERVGNAVKPQSIVMLPVEGESANESRWAIDTIGPKTRGDQFENYKEALDVRKLRAILVPERAVTQDEGTGSYKMAEVHAGVLVENIDGLIADFEHHVNKYCIPQLVKYTFGDKAPAAMVEVERLNKEQKAFWQEIYMELIRTGRATPAIDQIEATLNIPQAESEAGGGGAQQPETPEKKAAIATAKKEEKKEAEKGLTEAIVKFREKIRHAITTL